jgi:hypothetical protein
MELSYNLFEKELPKNKDLKFDTYKDKIIRELDCSVIEYMHQKISEARDTEISEKGFSDYKIFDSARGILLRAVLRFQAQEFKVKITFKFVLEI